MVETKTIEEVKVSNNIKYMVDSEDNRNITVTLPRADNTNETNQLLVEMFRQYFHIHTAIEKTELIFLAIGIIYFVEAIIKNTIEFARMMH